jgi:hypothetical protein
VSTNRTTAADRREAATLIQIELEDASNALGTASRWSAIYFPGGSLNDAIGRARLMTDEAIASLESRRRPIALGPNGGAA